MMNIKSGTMTQHTNLSNYPALLLNADFQPLTVHPLSTLGWQDAVKAVWSDKVSVLEEYDIVARSEKLTWKLPSVVVLKEYIKREEWPVFNRYNIFLRDNFSCQYCGSEYNSKELTFDHVVPRHANGKTTWENVVAACQSCNRSKGPMTLHQSGMRLLNAPRKPSSWELYLKGRRLPHDHLHETWHDYLYWDTKLES